MTTTETSHSRNPWAEMRDTQNQRTLIDTTGETLVALVETLIPHAVHPNQPTTETPWHHKRRKSAALTCLCISPRTIGRTAMNLPNKDPLWALAITIVESLDEVDRQTYTLTPA